MISTIAKLIIWSMVLLAGYGIANAFFDLDTASAAYSTNTSYGSNIQRIDGTNGGIPPLLDHNFGAVESGIENTSVGGMFDFIGSGDLGLGN